MSDGVYSCYRLKNRGLAQLTQTKLVTKEVLAKFSQNEKCGFGIFANSNKFMSAAFT